MMEDIQEYVVGNTSCSYDEVRDRLRRATATDLCTTLKYNLTSVQWSSIRRQVETHIQGIRKIVRKESTDLSTTDQLRDIQEFAEAHVFSKRVEALGDKFTEHTMFVAGIEIVPIDPPPINIREEHKKWLQDGKPKHRVRVAVTNIAMSMFIPAIASRADLINGRITLASDMTFKLFIGKFELIDVFCHDGTLNAKVMGFLITKNNKPEDYYFLTRACRNVTEHISSLSHDQLPGSAKLPFALSSPVPPSSRDLPMQYNESAEVFAIHPDAGNDAFQTRESSRYSSEKSRQVRQAIDTPAAQYYPPLVPVPDDNIAKSFRFDTAGIDYVSMSDGDVSIKQGLGAAIPSISNTHGSCYVHQLRTNNDVINGKKKEYVDAGKAPVFHSDHDDDDDKKKDVKRKRAKFLLIMQEELLAIKFCSNQELGAIMFGDLLARLRSGKIQQDESSDEYIHGDFEGYAGYLEQAFNRTNAKGCQGVHRYPDLLDLQHRSMDGDGCIVSGKKPPVTDIEHGVVDNTNSLEAAHLHMKNRLDNQRLTVPSQLDRMMDAGESYTREEVEKAGVSPMPVVYGSHRQTTTHFALEIDIGMLFLGAHTKQYSPLDVCQRQDRMIVRRSGLRTEVFMLRAIEELEQLASEVKQEKEKEDGLTEAEISKNMFERHLAVQKAGRDDLEAMIDDLAKEYMDEDLNEAEARSEAINDLHEDERRFVLCTPIAGNLSQDHVQVTEPFRSMPSYTGTMTDRNVVYKWRCKCERFLKYGFCGNVFYLQHCKGWDDSELQEGGYFNTTVPAICFGHDPGEGRGKGRRLTVIPKQQEGMKPN